VKDSNEILGGYNPISWKPDYSCGVTDDSFIFSFGKDDILSRVRDEDYAIVNSPRRVPSFGNGDLVISGYNYRYSSCKRNSYKNRLEKQKIYFLWKNSKYFKLQKIDEKLIFSWYIFSSCAFWTTRAY
jgi:hypothetical protein